jgi:hypothetical protein
MKKKKENTTRKPNQTTAELKKEAIKKDAVKKGYNEKNPTQPEGAFKPDSMNKKN